MTETIRKIFDICESKNWRLAVAESCTGGGLGQLITSVPGASGCFWGGVIAYSNEVKINILNVNPATLRLNGAVSEEVAREMALGVAQSLKVEIGISTTGVAGPGAEGPKPEGRVCFGFFVAGSVESVTEEFGSVGRDNVRKAAARYALEHLASRL